MNIVGAGFAGLLAAHLFPGRANIFEAEKEPRQMHRALLRFRTDEIARRLGIEFQRVTVRKGIYYQGEFVAPSIALANEYSLKVIGRLLSRSIWSLEPVDRWVAPESLYEQLIDGVKHRIHWGQPFDFNLAAMEGVISTAPLPIVLKSLGIEAPLEFHYAPIRVRRWRIPGADVHQTVYFPAHSTSLYRASITGDLLIAEFAAQDTDEDDDDLDFNGWHGQLWRALAVDPYGHAEPIGDGLWEQRYGKIADVPTAPRRALLAQLTERHHIYSFGRFATWRNVLLDDLVNDAAVIRRLLNADSYTRRIAAS